MIKVYLRTDKANKIRNQGKIPGILYGPQINSQKIYCEEKDIEDLYKQHEGGLFEFDFENKKFLGILREIQTHPLTDKIIHFDIYVPSLEKEVKTVIPLEFIGEPPALKKGGVLNFVIHSVEVESLPQYLPEKIVVDLSILDEIGKSIYIKDLKLSSNIKVLLDENTPVVTIIKEKEEISEEKNLSESTNV